MSESSYDRALETSMQRAFVANPSMAATTAEVFGRLCKGGYYEQGLVDAIGQKWDRFPLTLADAYAFLCVYSNIVTGKLRTARISVGQEPSRDRDIDGNNSKLSGLAPQFWAEFWGGLDDHDGWFGWHDHLHVGGYINVDGHLIDGPEHVLSSRRIALEVGTQSMAKTLVNLRMEAAIARWPYGSSDIWVICDTDIVKPIANECEQDEDGWPCARTRSEAPQVVSP